MELAPRRRDSAASRRVARSSAGWTTPVGALGHSPAAALRFVLEPRPTASETGCIRDLATRQRESDGSPNRPTAQAVHGLMDLSFGWASAQAVGRVDHQSLRVRAPLSFGPPGGTNLCASRDRGVEKS